MFIVTDKGFLIRQESICYIRHIKQLSTGYDSSYYPEYSVFLNNISLKLGAPKFDLSTYCKIDDIIPEVAQIGYPSKSEITYYINLKEVNIIGPEFDCFVFHFSQGMKLIIHDKNVLEKISLK